jgi:hypothetical protein
MKIATIIVRVLLGLIFVFFGSNAFFISFRCRRFRKAWPVNICMRF